MCAGLVFAHWAELIRPQRWAGVKTCPPRRLALGFVTSSMTSERVKISTSQGTEFCRRRCRRRCYCCCCWLRQIDM